MANPACATGCGSALPKVKSSKCAPQTALSEIWYVYIAKAIADDFTNVEDIAEWTTRLSEDSVTGDDMIRQLTVLGNKPQPTSTTIRISGGRSKNIGTQHVVNFRVDDISPENYEFARMMQCGGTYKFWWETAGGYMYGGNSGKEVTLPNNMVNDEGADAIERLVFQALFTSQFDAERTISPFGPLANTIVLPPPVTP